MLLALVFTDLEKRLLPDELTLGGTLVGLAFAPFAPISDESSQGLLWLAGLRTLGVESVLAAGGDRSGSPARSSCGAADGCT